MFYERPNGELIERPIGWPPKASEPSEYLNCMGQYTALTEETFVELWDSMWYDSRHAKLYTKMIFSGDRFALETLLGPEMGLLHPGLHHQYVEVLNVSKNQLTSIDCLSSQVDGLVRFAGLKAIDASRNLIPSVSLHVPTVLDLNLSYNALERIPCFASLVGLQRLNLSHNRIDDSLQSIASNKKLHTLDLSANNFSWKPTVFKRQLDTIVGCTIEQLLLWPNPFIEQFKEYQYLAILTVSSLKNIDRWPIDDELRIVLAKEASSLMNLGIYDTLDVRVQVRRGNNLALTEAGGGVYGSVPRLVDLLALMKQPLVQSTELISCIDQFEQRVLHLWNSNFLAREKLMAGLTQTEAEEKVDEFIDKMQQLLMRFDSVRSVLINGLVRLIGCANENLGKRCAKLLAEWIDSNSSEITRRNISSIADTLLESLCVRTLAGIHSLHDCPMQAFRCQFGGPLDAVDSDSTSNDAFFRKLESVAESASILGCLRSFALPTPYGPPPTPLRARFLRMFIYALARETRDVLGEDKPTDSWQEYKNFDISFMDHGGEVVEVPRRDLVASDYMTCKHRCARHGFTGFVVVDEPDDAGSDQVKVYFKKQDTLVLLGMRRSNPGRTLHIGPTKASKPPVDRSMRTHMVWSTWYHGLAVMVAATEDPHSAAEAVRLCSAHTLVLKHLELYWGSAGSAHSSSDSDILQIMQYLTRLATNLTRASGGFGKVAASYFVEQGMHTHLHHNLSARLFEQSAPVSTNTLRNQDAATTMELGSLITMTVRLAEHDPSVLNDFLRDRGGGSQKIGGVFSRLIDINVEAGSGAVPDPWLLAASLQLVYEVLSSDVHRPVWLQEVLNKFRDFSILLPYVQGPKIGSRDNAKYQGLWRQCVLKYDVIMSLGDQQRNLILEVGNQGWRKLVPEIKDLNHPLMHQVLWCIVRIFQLVIEKVANDSTGFLKQVVKGLDDAGRDEMLLHPVRGLLRCPDLNVKAACLKCLQYVLQEAASQFNEQEMAWLLSYMTDSGIGIGQQATFLVDVVGMIILLVRNPCEPGDIFRKCLGKAVIRQAFALLRMNCQREASIIPEEEEASSALSLSLCEVLKAFSLPLSDELRFFMRNPLNTEALNEVLRVEDAKGRSSCRATLLRTWTSRCMRGVLLPMVEKDDSSFDVKTKCSALGCIADVIQGRIYHAKGDKVVMIEPQDESDTWPDPSIVWKELEFADDVEVEDWRLQQHHFIYDDGIRSIVGFAHRYMALGHRTKYRDEAARMIIDSFARSEDRAKRWLDNEFKEAIGTPLEVSKKARSGRVKAAGGEVDKLDAAVTNDTIEEKLRMINTCVKERYGYNINIYSAATGGSLRRIKQIVLHVFNTNQKEFEKLVELDPDAGRKLCEELDNMVFFEHRLVNDIALRKAGIALPTCRQALGASRSDRKRDTQRAKSYPRQSFLTEAANALVELKKCLLSHSDHVLPMDVMRRSQAWVHMQVDHSTPEEERYLTVGLASFLDGAVAYDNGVMTIDNLEMLLNYRYGGDLSRVRNAARILLEYRTIPQLLNSFDGLVESRRFDIVRVKNHFRSPDDLGTKNLIIMVEILLGSNRHICEIEMVVGPNTVKRRKQLKMDLMSRLRDDCEVLASDVAEVAEFIIFRLKSSTIRHGDSVLLMAHDDNRCLEVRNDNVFAVENVGMNSAQQFRLERVDGDDAVRIGDLVRLQNEQAGKYLEFFPTNHHIVCRLESEFAQKSNFCVFMVEGLPREKTTLSSYELFGRNKDSDGMGSVQEPRPLRGHTSIRLRAADTAYYLSTPLSTDDWLKAFGKVHDDNLLPSQTLRMTHASDRIVPLGPNLVKRKGVAEARANFLLRHSLMRTSLPNLVRSEGKLCHAEPDFFAVACNHSKFNAAELGPRMSGNIGGVVDVANVSIANRVGGTTEDDELSVEKARCASFTIAALLRCIYGLLTQPSSLEAQQYALNAFLGDTATHSPLLHQLHTLVYTAHCLGGAAAAEAYSSSAAEGTQAVDVVAGWLAAKYLRVLEMVLWLCLAFESEEELLAVASEKDEQQRRLLFLNGISVYITMCLAPTLALRLDTAMHMPLNKVECVLLQNFAKVVWSLTRAYLSIPLRWSPQRMADAFVDLVPDLVVKVLVQSMLYAMHHEALVFRAYDPRPSSEKVAVRLLSSLVCTSIHTVCVVVQVRMGSATASCEYDVCEAISQLLSSGMMVVPRARLRHFMVVRTTELLRGPAEIALSEHMKSGETLLFLGHAWTGFLPAITKNPAGRLTANESGFVLQRLLIVVTSLMRLAVLNDDVSLDIDRKKKHLVVSSIRDLTDLAYIMLDATMTQLLALWWEGQSSESSGEAQGAKLEVFVFETNTRRREFRHVLARLPYRGNLTSVGKALAHSAKRGRPEVHIQSEFMSVLQETCRNDRPSPVKNVTFLRPREGNISGETLEVSIMTKDAIAIVGCVDFMKYFSAFGCSDMDLRVAHIDDSDTDLDGLPESVDKAHAAQRIARIEKIPISRGGAIALEIRRLNGVWFLAEAEPKARLQFGSTQYEFSFFTDGERQRWRKHLYAAIAHVEATEFAGNNEALGFGTGSPWSVVTTKAEHMHEVDHGGKKDLVL